ncbi:MAG TPA: hypothetical protein VFE47_04940 [Tepidisphaeraceae bacterium]|jgi:uncharacterized protein (DUF1501 family)|nr:hypothetical protein [Tepidisphaeraceae bacterium]
MPDVKFTVDFRSVYAGVLANWMGIGSEAVLGGKFEAMKMVKA